MIRYLYRYTKDIPAIWLDGCLYVAVAVFMFLQNQFGSDEAAKYVSPHGLFWITTIVGALGAGALALKLFRSSSYAEHIESKKTISPTLVETTVTTETKELKGNNENDKRTPPTA